ncbi:ERO1-like protein alpha [Halotydeus destructor]|nr:ERO1-like protein alpha [Halotydeus destructor]
MDKKTQPRNVLLWSTFVLIAAIIIYYYVYVFTPHGPSVGVKPEIVPTKPKAQKISDTLPPVKRQTNSGNDEAARVRKYKQNQHAFLINLKNKKLNNYVPINNGDLTVSNINTFNNVHLAPLFDVIASMDYFRYVKLNLKKKCLLWSDNTKCALRDCSILFCDESDLPDAIRNEEASHAKSEEDCPPGSPVKLSQVEYVSSEYEDTLNSVFECSLDDMENGQYIDLLQNPERYTGYKGDSTHRIWKSIYEENCFFKNGKPLNPFILDNLCYEERVFYRAISGLHTSINVHLCAGYPLMDGTFTYNVKEFVKRFQDNEDYLTNLYFIYILELRALQKSEQYLLSKLNQISSGDLSATKEAIRNLAKAVKSFKWHFNESNLFEHDPQLAHEFAGKFRNITTNIMDCVACDKCKLWGKVQTHGLGTAFKILITDDTDNLHLTRHEIVTLINALAKLSFSIRSLDTFEKMLIKTSKPGNGFGGFK